MKGGGVMNSKKHTVINNKTRDIAMRFICDYHIAPKEGTFINADSLIRAGLPSNIDAAHVVAILESEGYIKYHKPDGFPTKRIDLTPAGKCYFERKIEAQIKERKESVRYWITTAIAILAFLLALISLATQVGLVSLPMP